VHRVAESGRLRVSERRAVDLIQASGIGTNQTLLATPPEHRDADLADGMFEAILRQILVDASDSMGDGWSATAVAFRAITPRLEALTEAEQRLLAEWLDRVIAGL
jgi:hypothetical protein